MTLHRALWPQAVLLLAAALFLRALVPSGWMPVAGEDGLRLMICSGDGPVEITGPASHHRAMASGHAASGHHGAHADHAPAHDGDAAQHDPCPYGLALGNALDLPGTLSSMDPPAPVDLLFVPAVATTLLALKRSPKAPARGPPQLA